MKSSYFFRLFGMALVLAVGTVACIQKGPPKGITPIDFNKSVRVGPEPRGPNDGPTATDVKPLPPEKPPTVITDPVALPPIEEIEDMIVDREQFKNETIYFEYDRSTIRPGETAKANTVANHLKRYPNFKLQVEGHCDERGTEEYNRSLGERRALSVREHLMRLGVGGDRIHTLSYGEDKPADSGHDEAAWAKNRRGEFILLKPKP